MTSWFGQFSLLCSLQFFRRCKTFWELTGTCCSSCTGSSFVSYVGIHFMLSRNLLTIVINWGMLLQVACEDLRPHCGFTPFPLLSCVSTPAQQKTILLGFFSCMVLMLGKCAIMAQLILHWNEKGAQERAGENRDASSAQFRFA